MKSIIWKNRANFILGLLIILAIFSGLPTTLRETLVVALAFLVVVFGFAGSRFIGVTPIPPAPRPITDSNDNPSDASSNV